MVVHRAAPEPFQQAAMLALGFCNRESVGMLLEELQTLIDDYSSTRTSVSAQALEVISKHALMHPVASCPAPIHISQCSAPAILEKLCYNQF